MVFDLGGGTFDVSILDIGDGVFEVRSTSGDTQLGGNDFDRRIVDWLAEEFLKQEGVDLRKSDRQALQRLTEAAEKAKIELSKLSVTEINLPFITATEDGPKHIEIKLNRAQFEELCGDLVSRLRRPLKRAISDAGLSPMDIDEVVLVGGSTRMPMVQDLVRSYIDLEPNQNVNPDEVVAIGAAIQSGIMTNEVKDILLLDVTPLSLGLETIGGVMKKLLPRNTTIPVRRSDVFSTGENNQTVVEIHALQGEREMANGNKSLGRFKLTGIPPAPRGVPQIQVSFDIDANGILQVTARDKTTGREQGITVSGASTLSDAEINRMISEADKFAEEDRARRERIEKRNRAKALTDQAQRKLKEVTLDFGSQFASYYRSRIDVLCEEILKSLEQDDERSLDRAEGDLQDTLYELNREIRLQYDDEEDDNFFGAIKKTFLGDDDDKYMEDYSYNPRQTDYYGDYGGSQGSQGGYGYPPSRDVGRPAAGYGNDSYEDGYNDNLNDGYDDYGSQSRRPAGGYDDRSNRSYDSPSRRGYSADPYDPYSSNPSNRDPSPPRRETPPSRRADYPKGNRRDNYPPQDPYNSRNPARNDPYSNDWDDEDDEWF
jgi:molecular chaperone DnaK